MKFEKDKVKELIEDISKNIDIYKKIDKDKKELYKFLSDYSFKFPRREFHISYEINNFFDAKFILYCYKTNMGDYLLMEDDTWKCKYRGFSNYRHNLSDANIDVESIINPILSQIKEETGLDCQVYKHKYETPEKIQELEDLEYFYPGYELILGGDQWYKGWDIPDKYFIFKYDCKFHVVWNNSSHGGFLENHEIYPNIDNFLKFLNISIDDFEKWIKNHSSKGNDNEII